LPFSAAVLLLFHAASNSQEFPTYRVGAQSDGSVVVTTNQVVTPAGTQIDFSGRPLAIAIRPDQKSAALLTVGGSFPLLIVDLATGKVKQQFANGKGRASYAGLIYSADGKHLYYSEDNAKVCVARVAEDGAISLEAQIPIPQTSHAVNNGSLALSRDEKKLYVVLNMENALGVIDLDTKEFTGQIAVGNAPHTVVISNDLAFVTNEGGRSAREGDFTALSAGTKIVADPESAASVTGTVSVVDLLKQRVVKTIEVGLHPTAALAHEGYVFVANTNSDSVSVIDARAQRVVKTLKINSFEHAPFGNSPNALAFTSKQDLAVSLGANNTVALYRWTASQTSLRFEGFIPTGWYPVGIGVTRQPHASSTDNPMKNDRERLIVANAKGTGVGSKMPDTVTGPDPATNKTGKATHSYVGSVSLVDIPNEKQLTTYTHQVALNNGWHKRDLTKNVPIVFKQPSPIQHVFYVIKENRTYDQVLGDDPRGDGDASLVQFGKRITPNQHALAESFSLFDNFYDSGILSADGHQWTDQAFAPDYIEKGFAGFKRSYPYNGGDSLAYTPTGFLWMNALRNRKTVRMYGEYAYRFEGPKKNYGNWSSWYSDSLILEGKKTGSLHVQLGEFKAVSDVPSADKLLNRNFPPFDTEIPDQYRLDIFLRDFESYVNQNNLPNLVIMTLCADHTSGIRPGAPTPAAQVADNDLAVGRLIDAVSHSRYWSSSAIFILEDDSQDGVDHIDAHRSTAFVVSPYARRRQVNHTYYTQISMVRTIEQILGLPPMTQRDLASDPMLDVFQDSPDLTPYTVIPNQIALDTLNQKPQSSIVRKWQNASSKMFPHGPGKRPDTADENLLNRAIWYGTKGFSAPYPGDRRVLSPKEVPKASTKPDTD
jgi:YVTN family beta-propeller protein